MTMAKISSFVRPVKFSKDEKKKKSVTIMNMLLRKKLAPVARLKKSALAQKPGERLSVMFDKMIWI